MHDQRHTPSLPGLSGDTLAARKTALIAEIQRLEAAAQQPRHTFLSGLTTILRPIPMRLAVSGAGLAAVAIAAVVVLGSGPGAAPAYASWTSSPAIADPAELSALAAACQERLATRLSPGTPAPQRVVAAEKRGDISAVVLDSPNNPASYGACIRTPEGGLIAGQGEYPRKWPDSQISMIGGPSIFKDGAGATTMFGRIPSNASSVEITTFSGLNLNATVSNGWYFAWWPASHDNLTHHSAKTLTTKAPDGTILETVDAQGGKPQTARD